MSDEGSEDSPPRPKRKIKKVMVLSSDSSSDSDESVAVAGIRRKRLRVVSDEGSDSSGSSVVCAGSRRKRALPQLRDSEADSDNSGWSSDRSDVPKPTTSVARPASGFASDSSEGNSDKCSICLLRFTNQQVGTPQSCEHIFCLDCITEWSKNVNTCPVDRMTFDFIVVRACAGGRVLRTEPVKVIERRPSVEMLVIEDPTICQVCGRTDSEETMLLCDGCDLGYHMACLTPPLDEVPIEQWLCPNCDDLLSDVEILFSGVDVPLEARQMPTREARSSRLSRSLSITDEPSTSSGNRGSRPNSEDLPTSSRGIAHRPRTRNVTTRRKPTTQRRRHKRRRTKTVIIEYEIQENGKFPVTKRVKRKITKRRTKRRQPRTAARRTHVRASVRARLESNGLVERPALASHGACELSLSRQRAGIPALSLFGDSHQLDYFSEDDEHGVSETASTAVAARPTSSILSAYRQSRRKMISIPSPPHAAAAPDVLSSILESQTRLHSKNSIVSISVDGSVNIKVETLEKNRQPKHKSQEKDKVDLSKVDDATKKVPTYPGQSRGGGGWGGGYQYRSNYHRDQNTNNFNNRGGNFENNYGGGGYQNRQGNSSYQNNNMRRDDGDYNNYSRRPHQYPLGDDLNFDRNRRQVPMEQQNRTPMGMGPGQGDQQRGRYSLAPSWQPYVPPAPIQRNEPPPMQQHRHSFGGFDNPLDMRMGQIARQNSADDALDMNSSQLPKSHSQSYRPLPEPPVFKFDKTPEVEKSEDERSDPGLVIDTEKYDPTEPTNDDDSGEEENTESPAPANSLSSPSLSAPPLAPPPPLVPPPVTPAPPADPAPEQHAVQNILAGLDTSSMNVPPNVLDSAVRAVLKEHRDLIVPPPVTRQDRSDDDSEGDCPNFSIYSATSVHIANNAEVIQDVAPAALAEDSLEDLVQEDDDVPPEDIAPPPLPQTHHLDIITSKKKSEELKDKVSKRCPITTNPRNPIKIKLNTPSLIKRHMTLYDDEEEIDENTETAVEALADKTTSSKDSSDKTNEKLEEKEQSPLSEGLNMINENISEHSLHEEDKEMDNMNETEKTSTISESAEIPEEPALSETPTADEKLEHSDQEKGEEEQRAVSPTENDKSSDDSHSDEDNDDLSSTEDNDIPLDRQSPAAKDNAERNEEALEKMTESISETEDERSYTPCLDENKSKDTSHETEKEKGIEGLDTEMISEDEGNEMFSDTERAASDRNSPPRAPPADGEEGEIVDKKKEAQDVKKKKKKDSKKEGKDKSKGKNKKGDVAFKKLSKSGKERNYRERDKDKEKNKRERRDSSDGGERERNKQRRKERRKDLERYDVRTLVSEKRRRPKDAFGRDVSPRRSASAGERAARLCFAASHARHALPAPRATHALPETRTPYALAASDAPHSVPETRAPDTLPATNAPHPVAATHPSHAVAAVDHAACCVPGACTAPPTAFHRSGEAHRSPPAPLDRAHAQAAPVRVRVAQPAPQAHQAEEARAFGLAPPHVEAPRVSFAPAPPFAPPQREPLAWRVAGAAAARAATDALGRLGGLAAAVPAHSPPEPSPPPSEARRARRRRDPDRVRHRRAPHVPGPSKEVFTSGDNILVSVSFKDQERKEGDDERRERRRERRRRRKRAVVPDAETAAAKPVAIIDLERSPFRELTPSPRNVIVLLSDEEAAEKETSAVGAASAGPASEGPHGAVGPKTPPEPAGRAAGPGGAASEAPAQAEEARGPLTPPEPPDSPDAYDPYEPTRSASGSPAPAASPPRALMTLEAAQKTNMSADDVIDRRPLSPMEKVMALLQSTRDVSMEDPPPGEAAASQPPTEPAPPAPPALPAALVVAPTPPAPAPPVRIVLPSPTRSQAPKLFLAKPSPIKSDPIKPMPAAKIARAAPAARRASAEADAESPYSPGSSDFGDLFEPPGGARDLFDLVADRPARARKSRTTTAKVPVKFNRKKGKTQVGVKLDEDNLKILDDLPSSAVEMQVKSKFLKKLNRQERVVEEVKLVLKPHYNKKHVTKDEYKDILRRAVPKICHNKSGEINPAKIQALVEAYVKKFRKKHKLGLV